jgi:hypothetical protein
MAKEPSKRPARVKAEGLQVRNPLTERREVAGLQGRMLSDLTQAELFELTATWLSKGMDGVQQAYGLTDGECMALARNPEWVATVTIACNAQRAGVVHRLLQTAHKTVQAIENKIAEGNVPLIELQSLLEMVAEKVALLGGMQTGQAQPQGESTFARQFNTTLAEKNPVSTLTSEELGKLQQLQKQLTALSQAGVNLDKPQAA